MCKIHNVTVLMSTYNGGMYLREQINSILNQKSVRVNLLVRDDGSEDDTLSILDEYKAKGLLSFYTGSNLGPQRSFMHLLQHAPQSEYYAFADQDDYWMEEKLYTAVKSLENRCDEPALYFGQTQLTDADLNPKPSVIIKPLLTFGESLIYKFIGGCTMVLNHQMREKVGDISPKIMPMHDIWIYSIAQAIGAYIYFDKTPHILYRQHTSNAVGQGQGFVYEWKARLHRFMSRRDERYIQAKELCDCYSGIITPHNLQTLNLFLSGKHSFVKRQKIMFCRQMRCADRTTQILFWANLLTNKY